MANQPKKYKKFVATAATATLVASAIVPVASAKSFNDVADNNDHKANIDKISDLGYMGTGDNFNPGGNLTRGQVAIILANWAKDAAGKTVPADYKTVQRFEDVALTADDKLLQSAALVFDNEIFSGSNGNLLPGNEITRLQMALVLNKAYGSVTGTTLVELAGDTSDVEIGDLDQIPAEHQGVVKALKKLGITAPANFNPNGKVTRGQFASFFISTIEAEAAELEVKSVTAANTKTLKVAFNAAVDTAAAKFEVKRGSIVVPVTAKWSDDKKSVELSSSVALQTGEYTVTVSGVETAEGKNSGKVTIAPERIEEVKVAANAYRDSGTPTTVKLAYEVYNQYGEKITDKFANTNFAVTSSRGTVTGGQASSKGEITITGVAIDVTTLTVSVVDRTYGKTANLTVNVRDSKALGTIELGQPELKVNKTSLAQADTDVVIPYTAKNQFGEEVSLTAGTATENGFTIISSNTDVVNPAKVVVKSIGGKDQLVIESFESFNGSKEVTLTAIANATGTSSKVTFTVNGTAVADTPALVAPTSNPGKGENPFYVELQLTDNFGNQMKAKDINGLGGLTVISSNSSKVQVNSQTPVEIDGKAYISLNAVDNGTANITVTVNATGKSSTVPVTVVDAKVASSLNVTADAKLASDEGTMNLDFTFKDQYGNDFDTSTNVVKFTVTGNTADFTGLSNGNKTVTDLVNDGIAITAKDWDKSITIKAELYGTTDATGDVLATQEIKLSSIKEDATLSYSIEQVPTLYGNSSQTAHDSSHAKSLVLVGLLSGEKVALPTGYATFTTTNPVFEADTANMKIWAKFAAQTPSNVTETGTIALWKGTTKLAETTVTAKAETPVITTASTKKNKITVTSKNAAETLAAIKANVEIKDQYGVNVTPVGGTNGIWTSSDASVLSFNNDTATVSKAGTVTVGYVTSNGKVVSFDLVIVTPVIPQP